MSEEATPEQILHVISVMHQEDPEKHLSEMWTAEGEPRVEYIEESLELDITAGQRSDAYQAYLAPDVDSVLPEHAEEQADPTPKPTPAPRAIPRNKSS